MQPNPPSAVRSVRLADVLVPVSSFSRRSTRRDLMTRIRKKPKPRTKTSRNHRSRLTNGRSGSATRLRRRSIGARIYKNALPNVVGTARPKFEDKELAAKFPIAPVSVVQFFGEPHRDVDVDVRAKKGSLLSHWPTSKELAGRLQWFKSDLTAKSLHLVGHSAELPAGHTLAGEAARQQGRTVPQVRVTFRAIHRLRLRAHDDGPCQATRRSR